MREYPVFIPYGEEHIAAVVTVPDAVPRGLVVLATGLGATRSHRYQIWTRTARRLASEHDLASVRWEYLGIGDSTSDIAVWGLHRRPTGEIVSVARFAMEAVGVDRVAVSGNCVGSWVSIELASRLPECIGACLIRLPMLAPDAITLLKRKTKRSKLVSRVRKNPRLRRMIGKPLGGQRRPVLPFIRDAFPGAMAHGRMLLLYGEDDFTFSPRVRSALQELAAELPEPNRSNYEVRALPGQRLQGFERREIQDLVVDTVVDWMGEVFDESDRGRGGQTSAVSA